MAQETLNIVITANNKEAITSINQTIQSANALGESLKKMPDVTNRATQSLTNLSRIAQDAPYGFMGIANNLNPMLESFQRLQTEAGGSGNALKAMVSGLMGPAGLGVAIGVASSLIVAFGDDIGNFFTKLTSGSATLVETNKAFHDSKDAFAKAYVEMNNLGTAFESFHSGTMSKKQVLEEYNSTLGKVYGSTKDVIEAEQIYIADKDKYVQAAMYRAAAQIALKKAAEEAFKQQEAAMNPSAFGSKDLGSMALSKLTGTEIPSMSQALGSQAAIEKGKKQENIFLNIAKAFNAMVEETNKTAKTSVLFGQDPTTGSKSGGKTQEDLDMMLELAKIKKRAELGKKEGGMVDLFSAPDEAVNKERKRLSDIKAFADSKLKDNTLGAYLAGITPGLLAKNKAEQSAEEDKAKALRETQEQQMKFADFMANEATGAIKGMWEAMKSGQSVIESLGNAFLQLAEDIAFAIIKAEILAAINAAMGVASGGASAGAGGGFLSILSKVFGGGMAEGGVVTGPTLTMVGEGNEHEAVMPLSKLGNMMSNTFNAGAMKGNQGVGNGQFVLKGNDLVLALQRSNYNLNLRRG